MSETKLWEAEHPFYCEQGNYLANAFVEAHREFGSWQEFYDEAVNSDLRLDDLNLLYRWDWVKPLQEDYEEGELIPPDQLQLFFMQQRKAFNVSYAINVNEEDEPAVKEWLTVRAKKIIAMWHPVLDRALAELE